MLPAFVLHNNSCLDRTELVRDLVTKTGATVVQSFLLPDRKEGCRASHLQAAKIAKALHPTSAYLVFEDDCVLSEDWQRCLEGMSIADVVYLGYNGKSESVTYGTHALRLSPKARDKILSETERLVKVVDDRGAFDHILSKICRQEGLLTAMPPLSEKGRWAHQKEGLVSLITGQVRVSPPQQ